MFGCLLLLRIIASIVYEGELCMILEYAKYGDLFEYIAVKENDVSEHYETIITQLIDVIDFLHSRNIVHLDLKPDNMVILSLEPFKIALIDFGYSHLAPYNTFSQFGTLDYMPPEIAEKSSAYIYDKDCDMWMLGVNILVLYHHMLRHPFGSGEDEKFARGTLNPRILKYKPYWPQVIPRKYEDVVQTLLVERSKRSTIADVKQMLDF
jgi:serine/threonine protein kinase